MRVILSLILLAYATLGAAAQEQPFKDERFVETLDVKTITRILKSGAWTTTGQTITSKETNNDKNPKPDPHKLAVGDNASGVEAYLDMTFEPNVKRILDVGGGKYDVVRDFMKLKNIDVLVWDPYNRSAKHNTKIQNEVMKNPVDAATSMAVLNVIPEPETRLAHINTVKAALKIHGLAYFKIWPGEGEMKGSYKPMVNAYGFPGFQANAYPDRFLREVQIVFGLKNANLSKTIPNLIIARKQSNSLTPELEIKHIQALSSKDAWHTRHN